jgi:hypothetical protein
MEGRHSDKTSCNEPRWRFGGIWDCKWPRSSLASSKLSDLAQRHQKAAERMEATSPATRVGMVFRRVGRCVTEDSKLFSLWSQLRANYGIHSLIAVCSAYCHTNNFTCGVRRSAPTDAGGRRNSVRCGYDHCCQDAQFEPCNMKLVADYSGHCARPFG